MEHIYIDSKSDYTLIMLHGTGGNEVEMANFGKRISDDFNILSIRGNVIENGMNRFFERSAIGQYNLESYERETKNLVETIIALQNKYQFNLKKSFVVGFSNGANIALGIIQDYPEVLNNYVLLSPDYINKTKSFKQLNNIDVYMSSSKNDPYTSFDTILLLQKSLIKAGANLANYLVPGHTITMDLLTSLKLWIKNKTT